MKKRFFISLISALLCTLLSLSTAAAAFKDVTGKEYYAVTAPPAAAIRVPTSVICSKRANYSECAFACCIICISTTHSWSAFARP